MKIKLARHIAYGVLLVAVILTSIETYRNETSNDRRVLAQSNIIASSPSPDKRPEIPAFDAKFVCEPCPTAHSHAPGIAQLENGNMLAVWYGGTREGAKDVSIFKNSYSKTSANWSSPEVLLDRGMAIKRLGRYIKKLGNPVVVNYKNQLWVFFVSVSAGGWSGSAINYLRSDDQGKTWLDAGRLITSPFFNVSTLVRTNPMAHSDGAIGIPVYHELAGKFGEYLLVSPEGRLLDKTRISWGKTSLQPSVISLDESHLIAFMRNTARHPRQVFSASSNDNGKTWGERNYISLPNPDASVAAIRDDQGRLIMALNNAAAGRRDMSLAVSLDSGSSWAVVYRFDYSEKKGAEFSYPSLIQANDGSYHLVYTWHRTRIKHVSFNQTWLNERIAEAHGSK